MVVLELELSEEQAATLEDEAEQFEFESTTAYLQWIVKHRSVVFEEPEEALEQRLAAIEERLDDLEAREPVAETGTEGADGSAEAVGGEGSDEVMDAVDEVFEETAGADDEDISEAIASIDIEDEDDD